MSGQLKCVNGHLSHYIASSLRDYEAETCDKCGASFTGMVPLAEVTDPDVLIDYAEGELENANYHSMTDLPGSLYAQIKPLVSDETALARAIMEAFSNL